MNCGKNDTIYFKLDDREIPLVNIYEEPIQLGYTDKEIHVLDYHGSWSCEVEINEENYQKIKTELEKIAKERERNR